MSFEKYRKWARRVEQSLGYWLAGAEMEFTEELARAMAEKNVSRAELARRISTSQAYITKILRGNVNFTLATMVKLARALDMEVHMHLAPRRSHTVWKDEIAGPFDRRWKERPDIAAAIDFDRPFEEEDDDNIPASA